MIGYTEALYNVITRRKATGVLKDCLAGLGTGEQAGRYGGYETTINGEITENIFLQKNTLQK